MRLCKVKEQRAIFHQWCERTEIASPSPMICGHGGGVLKCTFALVEYENGQVSEVMVNDVMFLDTTGVIKQLQEVAQ